MKNKQKLYSIALASATFIFVFLILISSVGSAAQVTAQVTRIGNGSDPAIYGNRVVWTNGGVIHLYDLTSKTDATVSSSAASHPAIYGNKLVWYDGSSGTPRLAVYDISTAAKTYITKDVDSWSKPAIYGSRIVWSANGGIYMRDISTSTQTRVTDGTDPDIYDTRIAYSYDGIDAEGIYVYDIITNETILARHRDGNLYRPHIYGNKVIWSDFYTRMGYISMYNIDTKETIDVTSDNTGNTLPEYANSYADAGDDTGTHIDINGDKIVYSKTGDDQFGYTGVYVYDIPSAKSTPVYIYPTGTATTPDIYNSIIVWGIEGNYGEVTDNGIYMSDLSATNTLPPVAEFTANVTSGTVPLVMLFTDLSTGGVPTSWYWDFGDGINSKHAMNATHTFTNPGVYNVTLTVANKAGNGTVTKLNYITVTPPQPPVADFATNVTSGIAPLTVLFAATDKGGAISEVEEPTSWYWDFGDGTNSKNSATVHTYTKPGNYTISLTVGNSIGNNTKTKPGYIVVTDPNAPVANFSSNVTEGYAPLTVQFMDNSISNGSSNLLSDKYYSPELSNEGENNTVNEQANNTTDSQETSGDEYSYGTAPVESIKIMPLESFPVQIQVVAEGYFSDGCPKIDKITTEREGNTFNIKISTKRPKDAICTQAIVPFSKAIPLEIQGLKAGRYTVNVNGIKGSFELAVDNSLNDFPGPLPPGKQVITKADNGTSISLMEGDNFTLNLRGNPSTDYSWEFNLSEGLSIISDGYVQDPALEHMVGVPGTYSWIIEAVAPGNQQVKGIYKSYSVNTTGTEDNFTLNVYSISPNTTSRLWDFGDGTFSTEQNPAHTYSAAGNYKVNLIVSNVNGSASKVGTITVLTKSDVNNIRENKSNHSSSGGGGGAGVSPEPAKNVEVKELCQVFVTNGKAAQFDFSKNATCVVSVSFDAKKTAGKTATIAEQLNGKSTLVPELPSGETYKSFNVWVGNGGVLSSKNIENPVVCFKVEKSWIKDKKIDQDSITLNRYNDKKWEQSPVNLSGEDDKFLYFTAKTSGFSSFAITGTAKPSPEETVTKTEIDYPEPINKNNTTNKEPQNEQKEILSTPGFEIYYGVAGLLAVLLYKRK